MPSTLGACLVSFACSVCALQASAALSPLPLTLIAVAVMAMTMPVAVMSAPAVAARMRSRPRQRAWIVAVIGIGASFAAGYGYAAWRAEARLAEELPHAWEGVDIRVLGVVDDLPAHSERGVRFAFAVEHVLTAGASVPRRLSLAWYAPWTNDDTQDPPPSVRAGERWQLVVRLKRPHGNVNPGGFDLEAWLLQQGLRATGFVRDDAFNQRRDEFAGRWIDHVQRERERVRERIERSLPDAPYAGVVVALAIGDQRAIPEAQWKVFNRTGITHLVSISGLHVTVFAAFAGGFAYALARRSVRLTTRLPARKLAAAVGMAAAGAYVMLAGAGIPALRTFAMLAVAAVGIWAGRPGTAGIVWLWALVAVLLWDPFAPLTPGFWLSYGAVALLLYASAGRLPDTVRRDWRQRIARTLREGAHAQWIVTLGLTPLTLSLFGQVSLISPVANAIAIPAVTLVIVPLALTGILIPWDALFRLAHAATTPLMRFLEWLSALPDATWQQHAPPAWSVTVACLGVLWLLAPRGVPGRWLGALWLLPLFAARPEPLPDGAFRLTVLDVGQGLAAVVETRRHTLVYDTGPRYNETTDAGGRIVAPFLRWSGLRRVDTLVVSHQDLDHSGGALSLLQAVPVGFLTSSLPADHAVVAMVQQDGAGTAAACMAGQAWTWDGVRFTMLHPTDAEYEDRYTKTNDRSCVLRVDSAHGGALLTGDIEAKSEMLLLASRRSELRADVLVVPHHGSRTSSTLAFIRAVTPAIAVIGSGYRNRFGHPRADIVARYTMSDVRVLRSDREGAIALTFEATKPPVPVSARSQRARYWLDASAVDAAPLE